MPFLFQRGKNFMSLPDLLNRTRRPLGISLPELEADEIAREGLLPGTGPILGFDIEPQDPDLNFWCWAAVSVSVLRFLRGEFMTQCELARAVFNNVVDCCQNRNACDKMMALEVALTKAKVFAGKLMSPITPAAAGAQFQSQRPLGCAVRWAVDGTAHFVVMYGVSVDGNGTFWVAIDDPKYGKWQGEFVSFRNAYLNGAGRWVASYFTA